MSREFPISIRTWFTPIRIFFIYRRPKMRRSTSLQGAGRPPAKGCTKISLCSTRDCPQSRFFLFPKLPFDLVPNIFFDIYQFAFFFRHFFEKLLFTLRQFCWGYYVHCYEVVSPLFTAQVW